ncbi:mitochondrial carrier domain-containing protein [Dipodascopsis uninucleata]
MEDPEPQILEAVDQDVLRQDKLRALKDVAAGTCGGIVQVLVGQPFDTTKVRLQSAPLGTYNGAMDVVTQLLRNEGPSGFYKGTLTPLVGVGACVSIQFGVFEGMKRYFNEENRKLGKLNNELSYTQFYFSGAVSGLANSFLASPIEHIRIRLQTQASTRPAQFSGPLDVIRKAYNASGIPGVFRGITPTLLREGNGMGYVRISFLNSPLKINIEPSFYFLSYEYLVIRDIEKNKIQRKDIPGWRLCLYGAAAGYGLWLTSYPFDVIKSRMQTDLMTAGDQQFTSTLDCAKKTYRSFGLKGFFKGFLPTMLRAAPVNASTFYAFELAIRFLG